MNEAAGAAPESVSQDEIEREVDEAIALCDGHVRIARNAHRQFVFGGPDSFINPAEQLAYYDPVIGTVPGGLRFFGATGRKIYNLVSQATGLGLRPKTDGKGTGYFCAAICPCSDFTCVCAPSAKSKM